METQTVKTDTNVDEIALALARSILYSALARGFRPPSEETVRRLFAPESLGVVAQAANRIDPGPESRLAAPARGLITAAIVSGDRYRESYTRLFGHTLRGIVSPYETEYGSEALFQQPQELADLLGFYRAFGLAPEPTRHERADHISCECEFLGFLSLKESYALENRLSSMLEETRKAARLFLRDHLGRFVPAFASKLAVADAGGPYAVLGDLCSKFVALECGRVGVSIGPRNLALRPDDDRRIPMACGGAGDCTAFADARPTEPEVIR